MVGIVHLLPNPSDGSLNRVIINEDERDDRAISHTADWRLKLGTEPDFSNERHSLSPNDQSAVGGLASTLAYLEDFDRAIETFEHMLRLGSIVQKQYQRVFGLGLQLTGHTDRVIAVLEKLARQEPEWCEGLAQLAATHASAGHLDAAHATTRQVLEHDPGYTASRYLVAVPFRNEKHVE